MSKIKSLQYLLLDALNKRKNTVSTDIASSLKVKEESANYIILWKENLKQKEIKVEKINLFFIKEMT